MLTLLAGMDALRIAKTHRHAFCWDIHRTDNIHKRFTSHDRELTLADGFQYSPVGGVNPTAYRKDAGLKEQNLEFEGVINDDDITVDDLRAGLYREATVTQFLVDWKYPWAGAFQTISYRIATTDFDGESYDAEVTGITRRLKQSIGWVLGRTCKYDVGDTKCGVNLSTYTDSGTVNVVSESRRVFTTSGLGTRPDGFYDHGRLKFTSGLNNDILMDVKTWTAATSTIELILPVPFDVVSGDNITVEGGCDKLYGTCSDKYSNGINYGGDKYVPGTDRMLQTPVK